MLSSLYKVSKNGFLKFTTGINAFASVWVMAIGCFILADVLGRVLFNHPLTGVPEIVKVSIVGIVWIQIPYSTLTGLHVRSTLIHSRLGKTGQEVLNIIGNIMGAGLMAALFRASWPDMIHSWEILEFEGDGVFRVPAYPIRTMITFGSAMAAVHFVAQIVQNVRNILNREKEA